MLTNDSCGGGGEPLSLCVCDCVWGGGGGGNTYWLLEFHHIRNNILAT